MKPNSKQKMTETQFTNPIEPSDFTFRITKIAVSQICQSMGFKYTELSALETLTKVATFYLKMLAKISVSYSNASNRTQSNIFDLINALHDLSSVQGFAGASTVHINGYNLLSSSVVKDISVFVNSVKEIPFAKPIHGGDSIPQPRSWVVLNLQCREKQHVTKHVPKWLPGFPDERTYKKNCQSENNRVREQDLGLWENNFGGIGHGSECILIEKKKKLMKKSSGDDGNLAKERGRVRFRIGEVKKDGIDRIRVYKRNWASIGGKRVCCD